MTKGINSPEEAQKLIQNLGMPIEFIDTAYKKWVNPLAKNFGFSTNAVEQAILQIKNSNNANTNFNPNFNPSPNGTSQQNYQKNSSNFNSKKYPKI